MKLLNFLLIVSSLFIFVGCGSDDKGGSHSSASSSNAYSFNYTDPVRPYCPPINYNAPGANDQQRKNNFCMAMMDNMRFGRCGIEQRNQAFRDKGCHTNNMQFNPVHLQQFGTPMYQGQFMVRSTFGTGGWRPIVIQGNSHSQYLMNLRMQLLNEEIRFQMGVEKRKEMFFRHFPDETFNCVIY